jgi:hypothetical protein
MFCFSQNKNANPGIERKLDSLLTLVNTIQNKKNDSTLIKIDKLDEVFRKSEPKWYDKFLPALIALFTVLISSGVVFYIGIRNAKTQIANSETQARTQIAIAADQIEISRKQIEQNTKNTLAQIRSNNISKARIEWIQNLRPLLSSFLEKIALAEEKFSDTIELHKDNHPRTHEVSKEAISAMHELRLTTHQILLFLNSEERSHKELEDAMMFMITNIEKGNESMKGEYKEQYNQVFEKFRTVLKEAWEQAKSETDI